MDCGGGLRACVTRTYVLLHVRACPARPLSACVAVAVAVLAHPPSSILHPPSSAVPKNERKKASQPASIRDFLTVMVVFFFSCAAALVEGRPSCKKEWKEWKLVLSTEYVVSGGKGREGGLESLSA